MLSVVRLVPVERQFSDMNVLLSSATWKLPKRTWSSQLSESGVGLGGGIHSSKCACIYIGSKLKLNELWPLWVGVIWGLALRRLPSCWISYNHCRKTKLCWMTVWTICFSSARLWARTAVMRSVHVEQDLLHSPASPVRHDGGLCRWHRWGRVQ